MAFLFELSAAAYPRTSTNVLPFNFTIDTRNIEAGSTDFFSYRLPLTSNGSYNFKVSWGDGTEDDITSWNQSEVTHTYSSGGEYDIVISENASSGVDHISWATQDGSTTTDTNDRLKLINVKSWGPTILYVTDKIFHNCENWYMTATDVPDFGSRDFPRGAGFGLFVNNDNLTGDFSNWSTSGSPFTGDLRTMLNGTNANPNLNWYATLTLGTTSPPYALDNVFANSAFTGSFSNWDTSNCTSMGGMFSNTPYNNPEIINLDISSVLNMTSMFSSTTAFNQDISSWDVSNVTGFSNMFNNADSFNQDIGGWNVGSATDMGYMFANSNAFNQDISGWDVSNVTSFYRMFGDNNSFNQPIGNWSASPTSNNGLEFMFVRATSFNQPLNNWDTSNVTSLYRMFYGATAFNNDISSSWDVSNITNFREVFLQATSFNQDISEWNVSSGTNFLGMFEGASSFNHPLDSWDMSSSNNITEMFSGASSFNQPLNSWSSSISNHTSLNSLFFNATSFNGDITGWNTSNITSMASTFNNADAFNQDISSWDVSNVTDFNNMFYECLDFDQDISGWNIGSATNLYRMFMRTGNSVTGTGFNQDIGNWDISNVTNCTLMFRNAWGFSDENYSNLLIGWAAQAPNIQSNVTFEANLQQYSGSIAGSARTLLTGTYGWTIIDAGDNGQ